MGEPNYYNDTIDSGSNDNPYFGQNEFEQMQQEEENEMELSTEILIMLFLLMLSIMGGHFLKKKHHKYLQESGLTTLIGVLAGLILKLMNIDAYMTKLSNHFVRLFMILLLPPIIFEAGYNLQKKPFFQNIGSILLYAFLGTFIAILTTSGLFYLTGLAPISPQFTVLESLAFGSLISSTDPVAVLAIFKEMDTDTSLYILIFGESIFNDAISIVFYNTVSEAHARNADYSDDIIRSVGRFLLVFFGSVLIGAFTSLLIAFVLKRQSSYQREQRLNKANVNLRQVHNQKKQNTNTEISMMILCPWVSYLIAEGLELSGIVAIMVNGILLNYYAAPNISTNSKKVLKTAYETVAYSAETLVFIFLGIGLFAFDHPYSEMGAFLFIMTLININISRALNLFIVTLIVNRTRSEQHKVSAKYQLVMWVSGLRGAMAYALALKCSLEFEKGQIILIVTLLYSLFSILGIGSFIGPFLTRMNVKGPSETQAIEENAELERGPRKCCFNFKSFLKRFDTHYFSPLFIKDQKDIDKRGREDSFMDTEDTWRQAQFINNPQIVDDFKSQN